MLRHNTPLGGYRMAFHHLHVNGGREQRKIGVVLRLAVLRGGEGQYHEHRAGNTRDAQLNEISSGRHCHSFRFFMQGN